MSDPADSNHSIHRRGRKRGSWRVSRVPLPEESQKLSTVRKMLLVQLNRAKFLEALSAFPSTTSIIPIVLTLQLLSYPGATRALRMTALQIPQHVAINQTVKMECNFNLDRELLYSVKWYKDGHEFYRFVPKDSPAVQVFPVPGVSVDINHSTERSIALNSVELTSTGRYRCEVSAEAPAFQTVSDHADMSVVVLPEKGPRITGGLAKYQEGDLVQMNCTSAPSKPAALLTWFINGEPAESKNLRGPHITAVDERGLETAVLGLEFRVNGEHFSKGGDMNLKCLATIASMYQHGKEESIKNDDRVIKAPVMESRETRAQSHTRNDLTNDCQRLMIEWTLLVVSTVFILVQR
ncbi:uncharacterized protein [Venturia canescens]|uniref:uncharacterized protein n=1 Tax=Venturia canescens TaxID=32260 RepID=UPI001C9D559F|nr:uncharacterized protein LOC122413277 [Venturia canescens]